MPTTLTIRLPLDKATVPATLESTDPVTGEIVPAVPEHLDWTIPLRATALEIQALNQLAGIPEFPRPITVHPDGPLAENYLGDICSPPTADGFVTVRLNNYDYFDIGNLADLGIKPTTFRFIYTDTAGAIA